MTDQCRTNFYVNPSDAVVAIMDDNAPTRFRNTMWDWRTNLIVGGADTEAGKRNAAAAGSDWLAFNESWLDRTMLVYADEVNNNF